MQTPFGGPGSIIAQRYRLQSEIGKGAMGTVWRAEDLTLKAPVAVKLVDASLIDPGSSERNEVIGRFLREAQAAAALRSPHVVTVFDHGLDKDQPYMAMELLEGESLEQRIARKGKVPAEQLVTILSHVSRALTKAHDAGIIHRDLKPGNIFLCRNEDEELAKVLDFGIAKWTGGLGASGATATKTGFLVGTPAFMSPEQAAGTGGVDHRTDIWAMGVIAFQCLTGKLPFYSENVGELILQICTKAIPVPSEHARGVPKSFDLWFATACNRDILRRFNSAKEAAESLRMALSSDAQAPMKASRPPPPGAEAFPVLGAKPKSGPSGVWSILAVIMALAVAVAGAIAIMEVVDAGETEQKGVEAVEGISPAPSPAASTAPK